MIDRLAPFGGCLLLVSLFLALFLIRCEAQRLSPPEPLNERL